MFLFHGGGEEVEKRKMGYLFLILLRQEWPLREWVKLVTTTWPQHSHFNVEKCAVDTNVLSSGNSLTHLPSVMKSKYLHHFSVSSDPRRKEKRKLFSCFSFHSCCTWLSYLDLSCLRLSVEPWKMLIGRSSGATLSVSSINTFPEESALLALGWRGRRS